MAARPVFASIENIGLPGPARAALEHAQETLPATTAFPPTADEVTKARRVASEYHHVAEVYKSVSPEFQHNEAAAQLYSTAVANLAATRFLTPTPGDGQVVVPAPPQPGQTYLAMQAAGIGGPFLILAAALDGVKEDVRTIKDDLETVKDDLETVKEDVKKIKHDVALLKARQQDLKTGLSSLQARAVKNGQRARSVKQGFDRMSTMYYASEAQRLRKLNASLRSTRGAELNIVIGPAGTAPPRAITTMAQINDLTGEQLNQLLGFYHLPTTGNVASRKDRLRTFLCGETLATEPSPYPQDGLEAEAAGLWDLEAEEQVDHVLWDDEEQE